jgi:hypothetical protein
VHGLIKFEHLLPEDTAEHFVAVYLYLTVLALMLSSLERVSNDLFGGVFSLKGRSCDLLGYLLQRRDIAKFINMYL